MQTVNESTLDFDRRDFARLLKSAIKSRGLTYHRAAEIVRDLLPEGTKFSHVSMWHYASGRTRPRRLEVFRALCDAFEIDCSLGQSAVAPVASKVSSEPSIDPVLSAPVANQLELRDTGIGTAFIRLEAELDWKKALQIAQILRSDDRGDDLSGDPDGSDSDAFHGRQVRSVAVHAAAG